MRTSVYSASWAYDSRPNGTDSGTDSNLRNLARAILAQAFSDALSPPKRRGEALRKDALEWFFSGEKCPFSFIWICGILHIDSAMLREWVRERHANRKGDNRGAARKIRTLLRPTLA